MPQPVVSLVSSDRQIVAVDPATGALLVKVVNNGGGVDYSTSETDTGLKWIDGTTPIYQKVLVVAAGPNNTQVSVAHGIANLGRIIEINGYIFAAGADVGRPLISPDLTAAAASLQLAWDLDNVYLTSGSGGDYSPYAGHVIIRYFKTA